MANAAAPGDGFRVHCHVDAGLLCARVTGWVEGYAPTLAFFRQIAQALRDTEATGVLVVDESKGVVPTPDQLESLAVALKGEGFDRVPVAYVDVAGTALARIEAGEIRARSHGYAFRVFDNERMARIWLLYGAQGPDPG